jgi:quercetin dioxygenase-like cupin family protein
MYLAEFFKEETMSEQTEAKTADAALASHYIRTADVNWEPMNEFDGVEMKVLYRDETTGLFTGLFRLAPGATIPFHEHTDVEQTYVLEGSFQDDDGVAMAGDFISRPAGNRHTAHSPDGCIVLGMFLKPNKFL